MIPNVNKEIQFSKLYIHDINVKTSLQKST